MNLASGHLRFVAFSVIVAALGCSWPSALLAQDAKKPETTIWAKGTLRDEARTPLAGVKVYARATYHGGIRSNGIMRTAVADADGRYTIDGPGNLSSFSATLVAHVDRHPPAMSWFSLPEPRRWDALGFEITEAPQPRADIDLIIPNRGGKMEVLVTRDGKPAANVGVIVRLQSADPFDHWGLEHQTDEHKELYAICRPVRRTGPDGIARFENLVPGLYYLFAGEGEGDAVRGLSEFTRWFPFGDEPVCGEAHHIPVRVGETTTHRIAMFRHGCVVKYSILRDGKDWIAEERLSPSSKRPDDNSEYSPTWIGKEWTDTFRFETVGIKEVSFVRYNVNGGSRRFPYDSADSAIASSPRLTSGRVSIAAIENRGGGVRVRIEGADGSPLAGLARFNGVTRHHVSSVTSFQDVDKEGTLIKGILPAPGLVEARASGRKRVFPSENMGSVPADEELTGRSEILPKWITTENNEEVTAILRYEKVGYLRGRLWAAKGFAVGDYHLWIGTSDYRAGAGVFYKPDTGEFVAGPYRTGKATLSVALRRTLQPFFTKEFAVESGKVVDVELQVPDGVEKPLPRPLYFSGHVYMADGKTPAYMAALARYFPTESRAWGAGATDAKGTIAPHGVWVPFDEYGDELSGTPREPVAVAWLPGQCGAAVLPLSEPLDKPLSIVLPPPIDLRGRVTVVGEGGTVNNGTLTVRAQHEGSGKLDDLMSVETTAGADGRFELAGLTPGKYQVQAALDGIWLSPSVEFVAGEKALEPVALTIAQPGGPVLVKLTGQRQRQPEKLTVNRPEGPLRERMWPKFLTPDGAGVVRIPALEAGKHVVRVGNVEKEVTVAPLTGSKGRPAEMELRLGE